MTAPPQFVLQITAGLLLTAGAALPQQIAAAQPLTMQQAMEAVLRNYPSIRVSQEQVNAATAGIALARTAYLPRVDAIAQVNRATRNNVFGAVLPQSTLPSISGPVIGSNNLGSVWGSAVGASVSWEPFDFGLRGANVAVASATRAQSEAALKRAQFDLLVTAADAYLTVVAAQETVRAAQAGVERAGTVLQIISAQVRAELRPGADQSRAEAEQAAARTQLIQAQQALDVARANLAQFTGGEPATTPLPGGSLLKLPPEADVPAMTISSNPAVAEQRAAVEQAHAQLRALERSYFPRFYLQGAAYARGTGAEIDGTRLGGANGLAPNVQNYAVGFSVTFPVLDLPAIRAREAAQSAVIRSQAAKSEQLAAELRAQWNRAVATINGARRIAANTPVQLTSARAAVQQATARYQSGLGNITEVADAQRLLTQTEIDDSLARLGVWRGLLAIAAVGGDLQPFLAEASK
ncbi:TolC family protein [Paludibaculum fermentans]|uniref:TolC family protein n=1 Tax=Paludibaculum fermentans TaxID=1473598 RepID=A0A7S7NYG8_PALFE|nr:TolC family protein [Paludibaculum fermentans]QOY92097.1 TolC family protein [Paludibaculum fermentans]